MNGDTEQVPPPGTAPLAEQSLEQRLLRLAMPSLVDLWIVVVWFAVAGLIGAFLWSQLTPLAAYTRTSDNAVMGEQEFAKQIATDGWFFVIASIGGLVSGVVLLVWRRHNPLVLVPVVAGAGALATWLMVTVGLDLGPADPSKVWPGAAVGDSVPIQLRLTSHGMYFVWSIAALLGALLTLWGGEFRASRRRHAAAMAEFGDHGASSVIHPAEPAQNG